MKQKLAFKGILNTIYSSCEVVYEDLLNSTLEHVLYDMNISTGIHFKFLTKKKRTYIQKIWNVYTTHSSNWYQCSNLQLLNLH